MENVETNATLLGEKLSHYVAVLGKQQKMKNKLDITEYEYQLLISGKYDNTSKYFDCFSFLLRRLVPMKVKLKAIPIGLPSKTDFVSMMAGVYQHIELYTNTIDVLLEMPNLLIQKKKSKIGGSNKSSRSVLNKEYTPKKKKKPKQAEVKLKAASRSYGIYSQITRKEWGSAYRPAKIG